MHFLGPMYGGVHWGAAGGCPCGTFAEAFAVPFAEAAALASDHVEGFSLGPLLKLLRRPLRRPPPSLMTMLRVSR